MNTAARLQGGAAPGEILATEAVRERVGDLMQGSTGQLYPLKGFDNPVMLYRA